MQKFKVGDKVRRKIEFINHEWSQFMADVGYDDSSDTVVVDGVSVNCHGIHINGASWDPNRFELVEESPIHNSRAYTLISKDVPTAGVIVGYYNDTKEVFIINEPEVDWSTVAVDTKIYVRDSVDSEWLPRHFARPYGNVVEAFDAGKTSFTTEVTVFWKHAKLA